MSNQDTLLWVSPLSHSSGYCTILFIYLFEIFLTDDQGSLQLSIKKYTM